MADTKSICVVLPPEYSGPAAPSASLAGIFLRSIRQAASDRSGIDLQSVNLGAVIEGARTLSLRDCQTHEDRQLNRWTGFNKLTKFNDPRSIFVKGEIFKRRRAGLFDSQVLVFASTAYVLRPQPRLEELIRSAKLRGLSAARYFNGQPYAVAILLPASTVLWRKLPQLLASLTTTSALCKDEIDKTFEGIWCEPVDTSGPIYSPALNSGGDITFFQPIDSPSDVNMAMSELQSCSQLEAVEISDQRGLEAALVSQRDNSAVPWIFNELLNEAEYRSAQIVPQSVPPEIHLSLTGICNIECTFCSYDHADARKKAVSPGDISNLGVLKYARLLRLNSGNGEPTANPQLASIIEFVQSRFPHLSMNLFTNGILLDRPKLIQTLVGGQVSWICVSLNAASRDSWKKICQSDHFDRVTNNLIKLTREKLVRSASTPVVYGSMVLTRESVYELPLMPALCRRLGIDRFTAIPFLSLGYDRADRLSPSDTYDKVGDVYDQLYELTIAEAKRHQVSIELPSPKSDKSTSFGLEVRQFHDFANIEPHDTRLRELLSSFEFQHPKGQFCSYLWRQTTIGSTTRKHSTASNHYLYPCLGPLSALDFTEHAPFQFDDGSGFLKLWQNELFTLFREGQTQPGRSPVCDVCRSCDTRLPENQGAIGSSLRAFAETVGVKSFQS